MNRVDRRISKIINNSKKIKIDEFSYVNIQALELPKGIESLTHEEEYAASKSIYKVFKAINYTNMEKDFLLQEWHSWQVSILIYKYKRYEEFFIYDEKEIFRKEVLELSDETLKKRMNEILLKFKDKVNVKTGTRDTLSEDIRWSAREVSIILYFLSKYKEFPKELK